MIADFQPMLAAREPGAKVHFPVYASPKLDGVRAVSDKGTLLSRKLKLIPNEATQNRFAVEGIPHRFMIDGELICGKPNAEDVFRQTYSGVMSREGCPIVTYHVFDCLVDNDLTMPFAKRLEQLRCLIQSYDSGFLVEVPQVLVKSQEELDDFEAKWVEDGYEGVMIRAPFSPYKFGRSTIREGYLAKIKRFDQGTAKVIGFKELMINKNVQTRNELGKAKRSHHQENMVPAGTLGALLAQDIDTGVEFSVAGTTEEFRRNVWSRQTMFLGHHFRYKFFPVGVKDKPRHPIFLHWL